VRQSLYVEIQSASGLTRWTAPACPFAIDYSPRVFDDIRLAVTDAFFSLPRGGAEIGGILLGRHENDRVAIVDFQPMQCEHAFGPSFVLSPKDQAGLTELIAPASRPPHLTVVGWYHSHTRSEIFLSDADLEIHNRFFAQPWQIAVVLKPHTFQPMRAGFFFRESDGSVHASAPYSEIVFDALPMRPVPVSNGVPEPTPVFLRSTRESEPDGPVINVTASVEAETPVASPAETVPELDPPSFLGAAPPPAASRRWIPWAAAALIGTALGSWAYHTRAEWLPRLE
jgi:proteasome lid subunit RPN8/RPN11